MLLWGSACDHPFLRKGDPEEVLREVDLRLELLSVFGARKLTIPETTLRQVYLVDGDFDGVSCCFPARSTVVCC